MRLALDLQALVLELHVMKVLYCFLSGPWVYVLKKTEAFIMLEVVRVLVEHELLQDYFANAAVLFVNDGEFDAFVGDELKSFRTKNKIRTKPEREHPLRDYAA